MPLFTNRQYEAIAQTLQRIYPGFDPDELKANPRLEMWNDLRRELAMTFQDGDPKFQYDRFMQACRPDSRVYGLTLAPEDGVTRLVLTGGAVIIILMFSLVQCLS